MDAGSLISVDAMGGDNGPAPIVAGVARAARDDPKLRVLLFGDAETLTALVERRGILAGRVDIRHAPHVIAMDERPARALRTGRGSSLWQALDAVAMGEARVAFSAGNTGALVALAVAILHRAPGVNRPAIAVHWPANTEKRFNVALDMGANLGADAATLAQFAVMGAAYSRLAFNVETPRVGLLNVGSEDMKGREEVKEAKALLQRLAKSGRLDFDFKGFVEGTDITGPDIDVIVTDGFTGNVAMKASEGTAAFIRQTLTEAFAHSILSRIGSLFALTALRRLRKRIDPRRVNGGVFLGLSGSAVKSHGAADAVGHASALHLAAKMAEQDFAASIARQLAKLDIGGLTDAPKERDGTGKA